MYVVQYRGRSYLKYGKPVQKEKLEQEDPKEDRFARLRAAMRNLTSALDEQKREIHKFREALAEVKSATDQLHQGCVSYQESLGRIDLAPVTQKNRRLAEIMDGVDA